jgi:hypothetical protein
MQLRPWLAALLAGLALLAFAGSTRAHSPQAAALLADYRRAHGERSKVREAPTSRRAGRFVGVRALARAETKCEATEPAYASVGAMARRVSGVSWRTQGKGGRRRHQSSPIFCSRGRLGRPVGFREKWRRSCWARAELAALRQPRASSQNGCGAQLRRRDPGRYPQRRHNVFTQISFSLMKRRETSVWLSTLLVTDL